MAEHLGTPTTLRARLVATGAVVTLGLVLAGIAVVGASGSGGAADAGRAGHSHPTLGTPPPTRSTVVSRDHARSRRTPYHVQAGHRLALTRATILARKVAALSPARSTFTIAQSNILGSQHTRHGAGGYAPGAYRAGLTAGFLTAQGVDVGGMEEVQADQLAVLTARMPAYSFWPGSSLGGNGERLQIYWRSDRFAQVADGSVTYPFSSQEIPLPYVLLRDRRSGTELWVIAAHNSPGGLQGQRDAATTIEISLIRSLQATGLPVLVVGDMNEHTEFFCRVAPATGMVAANGGSGAGGCHLPPAPLRVDWMMGSGVSFSGYRQDATLLHRASDHYYLFAQVTATSDWFAPRTAPPGAAAAR